jgi:LuxR family maltose regulon positive regulatory protein
MPNLVERPRLVKWLDEGLRLYRLTLISAPAGFGKTTLLSEWVASCERPVGWLSLDEVDNDLTCFLTYFIAARPSRTPRPARAHPRSQPKIDLSYQWRSIRS